MPIVNKFVDIKAWKKAREVDKKIYELRFKGEFKVDYDLRSQIRRSSG